MTNAPISRMNSLEIRASASLASIFALRMLGLFLILPVFAVYARTLPGGDNVALVGLALGIYGLTQGCLQIPFGIASDRWGRKPVMIAGLLLFAVGSLIAALGQDIWTVMIGRAIQGAGAISAAITALIADSTREEHRTKAMAMVGASIGLTFAISLVVAPPLTGAIGVNGLFWLTGILALAAIAVVKWVVPDAPEISHADTNPAHWTVVARDPQLLRLNFGIFALHAVQMALFIELPMLMIEHGLPLAQHWHIYLPVVLVSFALMMPPIMRAERAGRMRTLFLGAIALLLAVFLGMWGFSGSIGWIAAWLLLFFVGFNILEASLPSLISRVAPPASKGLALGIYNTTQSIGLFVGGAAGGWLAKHYGASGIFSFSAVAMLAWLFVAAGMRELPKRKAGEPVAA
ncbi:MAG: MFS transporter [Burkholderiaceae bacterium]